LDGAGFDADLWGPAPFAAPAAAVLEGDNAFAVAGSGGEWDIVQAARITLIGPNRYRFSRLLRGQQGTARAPGAVATAGSPIVWLNSALAPLHGECGGA
jgi:hypothetical protein